MAPEHVDGDLARFVLAPDGDARFAPTRRHLATCFRCSTRAAYLRARLHALVRDVAPNKPLEQLLSLRLEELGRAGQFEELVGKTAQVLDVPLKRASKILDSLSESSTRWHSGPRSGISLLELGATKTGSKRFAIKISPGVEYPRHRHDGTEEILILQGGLVDDDGAQLWRGESRAFLQGTAHSSRALDGLPCILVARSEGNTILP